MKKLFSVIFLLVTACTPALRPVTAMERVNHEFDGRDANDFFLSYGQPLESHALGTGSKTYRWVSLEPGGGASGARVPMANGNFGTIGGTSNGQIMTGYCEVRILTDAQNRIRLIVQVTDSIGKFSASRCAEIFSMSPPK